MKSARRSKKDPTARRLMTIPGVGPIASTAITALMPAAEGSNLPEFTDSPAEETGLEPLVPATCDARYRPLRLPRHFRSIRTKPTPSQEGPAVRISFPPPRSPSHRCPPWPPDPKARLSREREPGRD